MKIYLLDLLYYIAMQKNSNKNLTSEVGQSEIVTLAVFMLGGAQRFIDTEDVAMKAFELAPHRFSWRKYPRQINLELVRVCLSNARKPDKGTLLRGSGRKGWSLTTKGNKWIEANLNLFECDFSLGPNKSRRAGSVDAARADRESKRLQSSAAWRQWREDPRAVRATQAKEIFRIDSYTKPAMLSLKLDRMLSLFRNDPEISSFLTDMSQLVEKGEKQ